MKKLLRATATLATGITLAGAGFTGVAGATSSQNWSGDWGNNYNHDQKTYMSADNNRCDHNRNHYNNYDNKHYNYDNDYGNNHNHYNFFSETNTRTTRITNNNHVYINNNVSQRANSGNAVVAHNTWGGSAQSSNAFNQSDVNSNVAVDNNNSGLGGNQSSFSSNIGNDWDNAGNNTRIVRNTTTTTVANNNNVNVDNNVNQSARSGNAIVFGNTKAGSATSGDASNSSSVSTTVAINNSN